MDADHVPSEITEILITDEQLQRRLAEVAAQVDADYAGRDLLLVGFRAEVLTAMEDAIDAAPQVPVARPRVAEQCDAELLQFRRHLVAKHPECLRRLRRHEHAPPFG